MTITNADTGTDDTPGTDLATLKQNLPEISEAFEAAYPALSPETDLDELLEETLGEGKTLRVADLTTIKVPSTEASKVFQVPDENGDKVPARNGITGIPAAWIPRRSMWESETITGDAPDCTSRDLVHGVGMYGPGSEGNPNGLCKECPMAARGSAGKGTQASKCKEQRLLFLITGVEAFPFVIVFPPASLPGFDEHGAFLAKRNRRGPQRPELGLNPRTHRPMRASAWLTSEIELTLEQDKNKVGQDYNRIKIRQVRELEPAEVDVVNMYGRTIDKMIAEAEEAFDNIAGNAAAEGVRPEGGDPGEHDDIDLGDYADEQDVTSDSTR